MNDLIAQSRKTLNEMEREYQRLRQPDLVIERDGVDVKVAYLTEFRDRLNDGWSKLHALERAGT